MVPHMVNSRGPTKKYLFMSPPQIRGFQKYGAHFSEEKKSACGRIHKLGASKILVPKKTESPRGGASRYAGGHGGLQAPRQGVWGAGSPPGTAGGLGGGSPPVKTI